MAGISFFNSKTGSIAFISSATGFSAFISSLVSTGFSAAATLASSALTGSGVFISAALGISGVGSGVAVVVLGATGILIFSDSAGFLSGRVLEFRSSKLIFPTILTPGNDPSAAFGSSTLGLEISGLATSGFGFSTGAEGMKLFAFLIRISSCSNSLER